MFGFLKDKLKKAVGKFTKDVEKESVVEKKEVLVETKPVPEKINRPVSEPVVEKKGFFKRLFGRKDAEDVIEEKEELLEELEGASIIEEKPLTLAVDKPDDSLKKKPVPVVEIMHDDLIKKKPDSVVDKPDDSLKKKPVLIAEKLIAKPTIEHAHKAASEDSSIKEQIRISSKPAVLDNSGIASSATPMSATSDSIIEKPAEKALPKEEKKGFFTKITETFTKFNLSEEKFEELFWDMEIVMLENNVAVEVIEKIKTDMKKELLSGKINRKGVEDLILDTLKKSIIELFDIEGIDLIKRITGKKQKPYIIAVIGVNGSGKTTSIAKLTHMFQKHDLKVVLSASDTFRAAAIQQLEEHASRLNTKLIKHDYNSDPAAVAFDAIKYAEAKQADVVIIDTAGRLHSNTNLMNELEKVIRVCKPDIKIFVGESITGNDCVEQAKEFDKVAGIDAIILAKADIDEKGGAAISVSYVTKKPILYLGTGQTYDDLKAFDPKLIIESLEL